MSGGKRKRETLEDLLERPWCYYCEKDFDDPSILQTHQREKHFACESGCTRKLNTASGLQVHTQQVHKKTITQIRNALPGREDPGLEVFGMYGIPDDLVATHRQTIIDGYYQRAAEYRAKTGNPLPGTVAQDPNTKGPRAETKEELKARVAARLAEKRALKAAQKADRDAQDGQAIQSDKRADSNVSVASPFTTEPMQVDARVATETEGTHRSPNTIHQPSPALQDNAGFQMPPNVLNGSTFNSGPGYHGYPMHATQTLQPQAYGGSSSPYSMQGTQLPTPVYHQATAPTPSNPPAVPSLPQRPSFNAPVLSKHSMASMHAPNRPNDSDNPQAHLPVIEQEQPAEDKVMGVAPAAEPVRTHQHSNHGSSVVSTCLVWFTHGGVQNVTPDEIKSGAAVYGVYIPGSALPTQTRLGE